jgi:hypothetical protein
VIAEALALKHLDDAARTFAAKWKPRPGNASPVYARALRCLVDAARVFAQRSDESWAAEVAELRDALRACHRESYAKADGSFEVVECGCHLCAPEGMR